LIQRLRLQVSQTEVFEKSLIRVSHSALGKLTPAVTAGDEKPGVGGLTRSAPAMCSAGGKRSRRWLSGLAEKPLSLSHGHHARQRHAAGARGALGEGAIGE
jgi:hypothetical protein